MIVCQTLYSKQSSRQQLCYSIVDLYRMAASSFDKLCKDRDLKIEKSLTN